MGGRGQKANGKKARAGLVRALRAHNGVQADANHWARDVTLEYRRLLMAGAERKVEARIGTDGKEQRQVARKGIRREQVERELAKDGQMDLSQMQRHRIRYFSDGAVIGSKAFVNEVFTQAREHFGKNRKDGARRFQGRASPAAEALWSARELRLEV